MATGAKQRRGNLILDSMPAADYAGFLGQLERGKVDIKQVIQQPGKPIRNVWFPVDAVLSIVATTDDGGVAEVATIGGEGFSALSILPGQARTGLTVLLQIPGICWRCGIDSFRDALNDGGCLNDALHRYTECLLVQTSQNVICNARHNVLQRCARWLLMIHDRVRRDQFLLTQEFLSQMLTVRRASVNEAATELRRQRLIEYTRGKMTILDRRGLEVTACECYGKITAEYRRFAREMRR